MRSRFEIQAITFEGEEGMSISFVEMPSDMRVNGRLVQLRQLQMHASHPDYRDDMTRLRDAATEVLRNALEDFAESKPYEPEEPDEDDERELGMGER